MASSKLRFDLLAEKIKAAARSDGRYTALSAYLDSVKKEPEINRFGTKELLAELVERILSARTNRYPSDIIEDAEKIYSAVVPFGEETENAGFLKQVFLKIMEEDGIYFKGVFSPEMYRMFSDKMLYIDTMCGILDVSGAAARINAIKKYAIEARQYFADERAFSTAVMNAAGKMQIAEDTEFIIKSLTEEAKRSAGIYAIDEGTVRAADENMRKAENMLAETRRDMELSAMRSENFSDLADSLEDEFKKLALAETQNIRLEASNARNELKKDYAQILEQERRSIEFDGDKLLREIIDSADSKIRELRMLSENLKNTTAAELYRINTEANKAVDRAAAMLDSDELRDIISELRRDEGLIERIVRVDEFSRQFDESAPPPARSVSAQPQVITAVPAEVSAPAFAAGPELSDVPADMTVNYYFNEAVPFSERISALREKKRADIEDNGGVYHSRFDEILIALIEDANPYLIGPSGCGKTYLIGQLSSLLGIECLDIGYINEEYDILGFQTASGGYNYPAFYRAYKYGAIVFCDEFDNSNSRAAVKLNSFMANGRNASYCFPNGERVMRHPNFRIIAAGNTAGGGADRNYSTREKIEESVQQRFTAMYLGYDDRLEHEILSDYPEWFEFASCFRRATDAWSKANDAAAAGIFTTRDAANIRKYLEHKSFSERAIIDYEFIETKDNDYLGFLEREMSEFYKKEKRISADIFRIFEFRVNELRNNGGVR